MYAGHFAAALALKAAQPRARTTVLLVGVGLLDLIFGVLMVAGVERVVANDAFAPGFTLEFIDWSHSLLSAVLLSALYAAVFLRQGTAIAIVCGLSVFSHFLLDFPMHPQDLALYPHSGYVMGLGWWRTLPDAWWFIEGGWVLAAWALYAWRGRKLGTFAGRPYGVLALLAVLHLSFSPSVMKLLT